MEQNVQDERNEDTKEGFLNLIINIIIPVVILTKFSSPEKLGPLYGLLTAISFPIVYSIYDFISKKKLNFFSVLGFVSVLLTGGFALFELDGFWFAVKEAAIPLVFAIFIFVSLKTKYSPLKLMVFNDKIFNVPKIEESLEERKNKDGFEKIIKNSTIILGLSFVLSAILNFGLAIYILKSPPGTEAFNQELGKMTALSFPVIMLPCLVVTGGAIWYLNKGIRSLTGLSSEDIFMIK
ncbi:MAG: MFS transporter [Halobacteriovoraceae bacterium]|nr:MFS transporter [Halobacteriovoraceae bacterium]|tara:strand:- start:443 stop:1153 length:711 start_codon:yes stop_codon:yes gene_type:complete